HVDGVADPAVVNDVFELASGLEARFSKFDPDSEVSRFNRGQCDSFSSEFEELLSFACSLERLSGGAFTPFFDGQLDLSGVAKGYIVDKVCDFLREHLPDASGSVNAGGDVRFFNSAKRELGV